jgi:hypothetical protein
MIVPLTFHAFHAYTKGETLKNAHLFVTFPLTFHAYTKDETLIKTHLFVTFPWIFHACTKTQERSASAGEK